ncbi:hypothetical protein CLV58_11361 [Spirosoma oryzae]|uniref:Uncharacterized protein n=1 Tax=Spirosoma oryzae TaxID=1469603 RepID=A0A2T0SRD3_9BACT|nr:hypothetical protein [Spirosoma oryzae]PRY35933.1 hypothetical protein CLV58_11361 [Spirosoma oryzae]
MTDYISILNSQIEEISTIKNGSDFKIWQQSSANILRRSFGESSSQVKQLEEIKYWHSTPPIRLGSRSRFDSYEPPMYVPQDNLVHCIDQSRKLLTAFVRELTVLGLPSQNSSSGHNGINIHVNQSQTVNLNVVISSLREELTGKQFNEIDSIIKSKSDLEDKKSSLKDKLGSFGSDVLSGVLSSLLTNPDVYKFFN